jgi:hypothetical protein
LGGRGWGGARGAAFENCIEVIAGGIKTRKKLIFSAFLQPKKNLDCIAHLRKIMKGI